MSFEDRFIYFPTRSGDWAHTGLDVEDVRIASSGGVELFAWLLRDAHSDAPAVLWLHGNAGNIADRAQELAMLRALDAHVLALDYRGYGRSTGSPSEQGLHDDARAAFDTLAAKFSTTPVVVYGQSLGGAVAVDLATTRPVAGLIAECTFTSVSEMARIHYGALALLSRSHFDALEKIKRVTAPKLILHGKQDDIAPASMAERLFAAAPEPKELILLDHAGHNDVKWAGGPALLESMRAFVHGAAKR